MANVKMKNSLKKQMTRLSLLPLMMLTIVVVTVSISSMYNSMVSQVEAEMAKDAELVMLLYDEVYTGEFSFSQDENGGDIIIYKGTQKITGDDTMFDELGDMLNIEISLFYQDTRIMTTLKNSTGNKAIGTKAAPLVKKAALETGKSVFYRDVTVYNQKCFAYYKPLIDKKGTVYGMIGVCRSSEAVRNDVLKNAWPIVITCLVFAFLVGVVMVRYIKKVSGRIALMDRFMNTMANGDFDINMPTELMEQDDEIKRLATDSKKMARAIKTLVEYDALTGLSNRRYGDKKLLEVKNRAENTGTHYCVSIGDIDFFKKVNDTYGHEMGDEILKAVADVLKAGMHGKGLVARWGGEEFMFVFDGLNITEAQALAQEMLSQIREIVIPGTDNHVTMSFGITEALADESIDSMLKRADDNLYEAKSMGRNQIIAK